MQERRFSITLGQAFWTWTLLAVGNFFYAAGITGEYANAVAGSIWQMVAVAAILTSSTLVAKVDDERQLR